MMDVLDDYLTPTQAAELFGVTAQTVRIWCRSQTIDARKVGQQYFIPKKSVQHLIDAPDPTPLLSKPYLTLTEAARVLQINRRILHYWRRQGKFPAIRQGRIYLLARNTVNELMAQLTEQYQSE